MYISLKKVNDNHHNTPIELIPIKDKEGNKIDAKVQFGDIEIAFTTKDNVDIICSIPYESLSLVSWYVSIVANYNSADPSLVMKAARKLADDIMEFYKTLGIELALTSIKFEEY